MTKLTCQACGAAFAVADELASGTVKCPMCGEEIAVSPPAGAAGTGAGAQARAKGTEWFYAVGREQHGPVSAAKVIALIRSATLNAASKVWRDGMAGWQPLGSVEEFRSMVPLPPPPPPGYSVPGYAPRGQAQVVQRDQSGKAVTSLVLGIAGLVTWIVPLFGLPITIVGLIMGVKGRNSQKAGTATAGIVLSVLGLIASFIHAVVAAYLWATGKLF